MRNVVHFVLPGSRVYRPEFVLFEDRKRRQWAVVASHPDGKEEVWSVAHGRRSEAFAMAEIWTRVEARRRSDLDMLWRHPLGKAVLGMTPDDRDIMIKLLTSAQRLTA